MSVLENIPSYVSMDQRIVPEVVDPVRYDILKGPSQVSIQAYPAQSYSNSSTTWNLQAPSLQALLDRKIIIKMQAKFTFARTGTFDGNIFNNATRAGATTGIVDNPDFFAGNCALRALAPYSSRASSVAITLNNTTISYYPQIYQAALSHYGPYSDPCNINAGSLCYPDQSWNYHDFAAPKDPLATFGNEGIIEARGSSWDEISCTVNGANAATIFVTWYEPFIWGPFIGYNSISDKKALTGLNSVQIVMNSNDLSQMLSADLVQLGTTTSPSVVAVTVTGSINQADGVAAPTLYVNWLNSGFSGDQFERPNKYALTTYNNFVTGGNTIAYQAKRQSVTSQALQLNSVPSALYIFCQRRQGDRNAGSADAFLRIEDITLTFGTTSGLLSGSNNATLYNMSVRNGCKQSHIGFSSYLGSVIKIDFSKDISLPDDIAVASKGTYTAQFTLSVSNISSINETLAFDIVSVAAIENVLTIINANAYLEIPLIDKRILDDSRLSLDNVISNPDEMDALSGGDINQCLKMFAKRSAPYARKVAKLLPGGNYIDAALDLAPAAYDLYQKYVGSGMSHDISYKKALKMTQGSGLVGAGRAHGGAMIKNKAKLRSALKY